MTKDELRLHVFDHIMHFVAENYIERLLQGGLEKNGNDVDKTIQWFIDNEYDAPVMGGSCGYNDVEWEFMVGWRGIGEGYLPGHRSWHNPPDITFTYRDILQWLADGKPRNVQLEMF